MEVLTQENKVFANYTVWLPWNWEPVKFMVNGILQAPMTLYSFLPQAVAKEEPFALYGYRTDPDYRQYKDWCFKVRQMLRELKQDIRNINSSRNKGEVTPSLIKILSEKLQYYDIEKIISPIYYDQQLEELISKIVSKYKLSKEFTKEIADELTEVRAQLKLQVLNQYEQAINFFYHDTLNLIIQKSSQLDSLEEELKVIVYYKNLVPDDCYQAVDNCIKVFMKRHYHLEEVNQFYKKLLQHVNLVFVDYRLSEFMADKSNTLFQSAAKVINSHDYIKTIPNLAFTITLATAVSVAVYNQSSILAYDKSASYWDNSFSSITPLWNYLIPSLVSMSPLVFSYRNNQLSSLSAMRTTVTAMGLLVNWMPMCVANQIKNHEYPASYNLSALNGTDGFVIRDTTKGEGLGYSISSGDINGDGIQDILIGAPGEPGNSTQAAGASYVLFGRKDSFNASFDLTLLDGENGFVIKGVGSEEHSGVSIASGDINGDGKDDVLVGALFASPNGRNGAGASYVVFGHNGTFNASFELSALNGKNGFVINGVTAGDLAGEAIASGDFNGDGKDDVLIGAPYASPNGRNGAGASYVVFGHDGIFNASFELSALNGKNGFVINGVTASDQAGGAIASGDFNGDGKDDVLIGAWNASPGGRYQAGVSYVVFGHNETFNASFELSELNGKNGFQINGIAAVDHSGEQIASGDINDDGKDDVLIGASSASPDGRKGAGASYVVFGHGGTTNASFELSALNGKNGFQINGIAAGDSCGASIASGYINSDNFADILIGSNTASPNKRASAGANYVVFGHNGTFKANLELLAALNGQKGFILNGANANDYSGGTITSADVNGDHFDDILIGAPGTNTYPKGNASSSYVVFAQNLPNSSPEIHKEKLFLLILGIIGGSIAALSLFGGSLFYYYRKKLKQDKSKVNFLGEKDPLIKHELLYVPVGNYDVLTKITQAQADNLYKQSGIKVPLQESDTSTKFILGKGQFGEVLIAQQRKTNEFIACKVIRGDEAIRASKHEAKLQQKLKNKPHVMPLIDSIETKDDQNNSVLYQFSPLAGFGNGKTLKETLAQLTDTKMKDKVIVHTAKSLLIALKVMHEMRIYHLDIKPKNFVINQKGYIYLIDFGCAVKVSLSDASITPVYDEQGMPISGGGDSRYFSQERLEAINTNKPFDGEKADAWALGVTLLELAMDRNPFNQENFQDIVRVKHILNSIFHDKDTRPSSFWSVIQALLEPNPDERLSIHEVLEMPIFKRKNPNITFSSEQEQEGVFSLLQNLIAPKSPHGGQNILNIQGSETNDNSSPSKFFSASPSSPQFFKSVPSAQSPHYGVDIGVNDEVKENNNHRVEESQDLEI